MDDPLEEAKLYQNLAVAYRDVGDRGQFEMYIRKSMELRRLATEHKH